MVDTARGADGANPRLTFGAADDGRAHRAARPLAAFDPVGGRQPSVPGAKLKSVSSLLR